MYPDESRDGQLTELRRILGLGPDEADDAGDRGIEREIERASRWPGGPPLGSYESRRAALSPPKRRRPLRFAVPILALAVLGFAAVRLLGMHAGTPPAPDDRPVQSPHPSGSPAKSPSSPAGRTTLAHFSGYPGQESRNGGVLSVNAVGAANGQELAVGSADGYPAIWRRGTGVSWSLAGTGTGGGALTGRPGNQALTAVTGGPAGWLAVGGVVSAAPQHPVVLTSADGRTWLEADEAPSFGGSGLYACGVAAGRIDYVIVGERATGRSVTAAAWWSAGLGDWNQGSTGGSGGGEPSEMLAVTVGPERFVAAGADGARPAVWTSPDGRDWTVADLALPPGATKAVLREVTGRGARLVATGDAVTPAGSEAFAEVSDDDGGTWREAALPADGTAASAVTALSASGSGFVAAGRAGSSAVVWRSADGQNWTAATAVPGPAGGKVQAITGLAAAGGTANGIGLAATEAGASPVVYTAP